jgi:cytochrome oxidase Cu insertion factor (SCO1/SenC/PrrC family)
MNLRNEKGLTVSQRATNTIDPRRAKRHFMFACLAAVIAAVCVGGGIAFVLPRSQAAVATPAIPTTNRIVPQAVAHIPLVNQNGQATDMAAFHGRIVIMADFMTSCQEECPITTGALLTVEQSLAAAHLLNRVEIIEVTVDAWRDTPSRLSEYQREFGVHWTMLTGSVTNLDRFWSFFGVWYQRVSESSPPNINWETGRPYTFDINHSDDVFVLDQAGNERAVSGGNADVEGKLPKDLAGLLDGQGREDLKSDAQFGNWTPSDMLKSVSAVLGQSIPLAG